MLVHNDGDLCMHHKFAIFPFTAIVGQETLKKSLLINAIDPYIGGVLIKGDKGTGKSTAVRSLSYILPEIQIVEGCPFNCHPQDEKLMCRSCQQKYQQHGRLPLVKKHMEIVEMPLSATEDMVIGTIDIKKAIKKGIKALEPGILARANRNILYIDEINLLDDHLVNILLDSAAMGVNIVEREGISLYHPSKFIMIGTMNPEEGELRPQILDRFGLSVEIRALELKKERLKIMKYRREFDQKPRNFEKKFQKKQKTLEKEIINAQKILPTVHVSLEMLEKMVKITTELGIKTHRADIVLEKTSKVLSALDNRKEVNTNDIKEAALMALPHRIKQLPFQKEEVFTPEIVETLLQNEPQEEVFEIDHNYNLKKNITRQKAMDALQGKNSSKVTGNRGMYFKAGESRKPRNIAVDATVRKAARESKEIGKFVVLPEHIMEKIRVNTGKALYIILLDSSSSMRLDKKIGFAKSLSWLLLKESYEKKNKVALLAFRGDEAEVLAHPTSNLNRIEESLEGLPTGGKTPLTPALYQALEMASKEKRATPTIIVISDGRGNVFLEENLENDLKLIENMVNGINLVFVNAESKKRSIRILEDISSTFNAPHFYMEEII